MYLSGYPTYQILDKIVGDAKSFTIYYDIKNNLGSLFYEDTLKSMLYESGIKETFKAMLDYITFLYRYSGIRKKIPSLVIFFDVGRSDYHRNILKSYKESRLITSYKTLSLSEADDAWQGVRNALQMIYKICNKLFNVHVVKLTHLESDFVPYYIIQNELIESDKHILISTDKDMLQILELSNTYVLDARSKRKRVYTRDNWFEKFKLKNFIDVKNFPYMLSIIGDKGDDVPGIDGISWVTMSKIVEYTQPDTTDIESYVNSIARMIEEIPKRYRRAVSKIEKNKDMIFNISYPLVSYKHLISKMHKKYHEKIREQLSFEKLPYKQTVSELKELYEYLGGDILVEG